jgi:hypothetical protein
MGQGPQYAALMAWPIKSAWLSYALRAKHAYKRKGTAPERAAPVFETLVQDIYSC